MYISDNLKNGVINQTSWVKSIAFEVIASCHFGKAADELSVHRSNGGLCWASCQIRNSNIWKRRKCCWGASGKEQRQTIEARIVRNACWEYRQVRLEIPNLCLSSSFISFAQNIVLPMGSGYEQRPEMDRDFSSKTNSFDMEKCRLCRWLDFSILHERGKHYRAPKTTAVMSESG